MQKNLDEKDWKEAPSGDFWKPIEKGDVLEGEFVEQSEGEYGSTFKIKCYDGTITSTPSYKVLISRMANVPLHSRVKITYTGEELPKVKGYKPTKMFTVLFKEA